VPLARSPDAHLCPERAIELSPGFVLLSAVLGTPPIVLVVVLVLDFFGRGKHADCQQRSKIENENEDDWKVPIPR
jgi:hypothetical protein